MSAETKAAPLVLPPPGRVSRAHSRRYTVLLSPQDEAALIRIARSRGERPGRVASLLVRTGAAMLDPGEAPGEP